MLPKGHKYTQEFDASPNFSTTRKLAVACIPLPTFQFIEGPAIVWTVDAFLYARFKIWKLTCENILEAELASLPDT